MTTIRSRKASAPVMGVWLAVAVVHLLVTGSLVALPALAGPYFWPASPDVVPIPVWKRGSPEAIRDFLVTVCRTGLLAEVEMREVSDHAVVKRFVQRSHELVQVTDQK